MFLKDIFVSLMSGWWIICLVNFSDTLQCLWFCETARRRVAFKSVYSHGSRADQGCPGSCSCGCGPWCGGVMVCPEWCSLTSLWWSQQSGSGVSWGQRGGRRTKKNNETTSGQVRTHPAWFYHSRTGRKKRRKNTAVTLLLLKGPQPPVG